MTEICLNASCDSISINMSAYMKKMINEEKKITSIF